MGTVTAKPQRYRSLFWPVVLIAVGVIWLLRNAGVLGNENMAVLLRLWPLLLIGIGLDLLIGRQSQTIGTLIGVGTVVLVIVLMIVGPSIGLTGPALEVKLDQYAEPRGDATSATVQLDLSVARTTITPLADSADLFTADVSHVGDLDFKVEGETEKRITLSEDDSSIINGTSFLAGLFREDGENLYWNIGLNPDVPLELDINSGVGEGNFDLSDLQLRRLSINGGVGQINLKLPSVEADYDVDINNGAGELTVGIADNAALNLNINGGVGNVTIDVPGDAAVRIEGNSGIGNVEVPSSFQRLNNDSSGPGENGVWESPNFSEAERQIVIEYKGGVGNLTIK